MIVAVPLITIAGLALGTWALVLRRRAWRLAAAAAEHAAARAALKVSEERLEEFSQAAAGWLWEIDAAYRFTMDTGRVPVGGLVGTDLIGLQRTEMPGIDPADPVWQRYCAMLDARETFRDFEFSYTGATGKRQYASISGHPLFDADGRFRGYRGTARDITAQVEARQSIERANALFDAVRQIQSSYIGGAERKAASEQMLGILLQLTASSYGFVGELSSDADGQRYIKIHALTNIAWDAATRKLYEDSHSSGFEFHNLDTLFGAVVRTGQPVIANSPAEDPRSGGLPAGHPPLNAFLGIPLLSGKTQIGVIGLANRAGGYDQEIVDFLEPLTGACGAVMAAIQADSEQRRVAQELRRSDERLQLTLESTGVGPWAWDLQTGTFHVDATMLRRLGYGADEILPMLAAWESLTHPEDLAAIRNRFGPSLESSVDTFEVVYRVRTKEGGWRWLLSRGRVVSREDGRPTRVIGTHLDITGVKDTEIALRRSEERFRALAESSRAVPWEADVRTLRITYVGPQIERITGFSPADWVDKDMWPQRLHPDDRARVIREGEERAKEGIDHNLEYRLIAADGRVVWIRDLISVIKGDEGQRWLYGVMVDITEEKSREQALRESESRYRQAERVAGIIHWNAIPGATDAWEDARLAFSETAERFFGAPAAELDRTVKEFVAAFVHPDDRARTTQEFVRASAIRQQDFSIEYRVVRKDGSIANVSEIGKRNYDEAGHLISAFGTIQDITERKQTENALRRAQLDAEMANRAKSQFLANVSHELRTPLNAIIGFSEVMKDELMGPLGAPIYREYSGDIHESGRHLLAIINDILDLSRVEAGQTTISESDISLDAMIASCMILVRGKANANVLSLSSEVPSSLPMVIGDERLLKQALLNLLSNAVKFTPRGGIVRVKAALSDGGDGIDISVTDSGIGMSPAEIEQVAKPFVQLENWLVRKYEGTGLGLSIVKAFCELHSGALRISSEVGRGTVTTIHLPATRILPAPRSRAHAE